MWRLPFKSLLLRHFLLPSDVSVSHKSQAMKFVVRDVDDEKSKLAFLDVPKTVYKDDPFWIPYIKEEIKAVFDPEQNPYFKHGEARRWVLVNEKSEPVGRIAAFINYPKMYDADTGKKIGCIGFFECINNQDAAFSLFDCGIKWLIDQFQVEVVEGPVNFGENDKFWGLYVKGKGYPSYGMNYNPLYYKNFFEHYGFQVQYRQFTNYLDVRRPLPQRFRNIAERISRNPAYAFRHFTYSERDKFIHDFVEVYNRAWESFKGFKPMEEDVVRKSLKEMKPIMEEKFIWFAYAEGRPVGLFVAIPDVNEIIRFSGASFTLWGKLKFLFYKTIKGFSCARVIIMGIVPEYQRHGLESALILRAFDAGKRKNYKHVQLAWVGDFNEKMMAIHRAVGAVEDKEHITYRKYL